jgi:hypothetical protein
MCLTQTLTTAKSPFSLRFAMTCSTLQRYQIPFHPDNTTKELEHIDEITIQQKQGCSFCFCIYLRRYLRQPAELPIGSRFTAVPLIKMPDFYLSCSPT